MYRFLLFTSLVILTTASDLSEPLLSGKHFTIYRAPDLQLRGAKVTERTETTFGVGKDMRTIIEYPLEDDDYIPNDSGGNFGDIEFDLEDKDGDLLARDTIINNMYPFNIAIHYNRTFDGFYVKDFKILNFGRERGWAWYASMNHYYGIVETEIYVPAGKEVRIFAETYGNLLDENL